MVSMEQSLLTPAPTILEHTLMKTKSIAVWFVLLIGWSAFSIQSAAAAPASGDSPGDFPYAVPFELGDAEFAPGDSITITELRGTRDTITTNESYCVSGTYTLASADEGKLAFFATTHNSGPTPIDPRQTVHVVKGSGTFRLIKTVDTDGYLHLSFYPAGSGSDLGGVYFGQGDWVLRKKGWHSSHKPSGTSGPNQVLFGYLGEPVAPPPNLDPAYTREGLLNAIQSAAQNAGTSLKRIEIDDSEFPFLIGVVSGEGDFDKLAEQLRKTPGYDYAGSVGTATQHAFNIVPWRAFPAGTAQRIGRRLSVRQQVLCDKIMGQ